MRRDKRRWELADKDGDNELNKDEFADFLHPEEAEHMKDVIVLVTFLLTQISYMSMNRHDSKLLL